MRRVPQTVYRPMTGITTAVGAVALSDPPGREGPRRGTCSRCSNAHRGSCQARGDGAQGLGRPVSRAQARGRMLSVADVRLHPAAAAGRSTSWPSDGGSTALAAARRPRWPRRRSGGSLAEQAVILAQDAFSFDAQPGLGRRGPARRSCRRSSRLRAGCSLPGALPDGRNWYDPEARPIRRRLVMTPRRTRGDLPFGACDTRGAPRAAAAARLAAAVHRRCHALSRTNLLDKRRPARTRPRTEPAGAMPRRPGRRGGCRVRLVRRHLR